MQRIVALVMCIGLVWSAQAHGQLLTPEQMPPGQRFNHWLNEAAEAYTRGDDAAWVTATEGLHQLRRYNHDFMTHLVRGYARTDRLSEAFNMMLTMQQQGLHEDWAQYEELEPLRAHRLYQHLADLMAQAGEPFGQYQRVATVPGAQSMPEALAYDAERGRLFVGTVRDGRILVHDGEQWTTFAEPSTVPDLMAVFSLVIDAERNQLIVATGMTRQHRHFSQALSGRTAIVRLDLDSGEHLRTHRVMPGPNAHLLGSLVLAEDGTIFAADTATPLIFRLRPDDAQPQIYFGTQGLISLRGLALDPQRELLYVADYDLGIFVVPANGASQAWKLAVPDTLNEGGIDGLYWWDDHLVAIQNGISPQRVVRMALSDDGRSVSGFAPVVAALESFNVPTYGVMRGSELVFLASSHWQLVDRTGRPRQRPLPDVDILATDVNAEEILSVGTEALEEIERRRRAQ